ncbi:hypothetical protein M0R45_000626 [Rubus argutus]|uniref:CCHC-type domain-containing protein n=1 Tax=Rubus argutus TaxID=59490 RepID=A0AAW1VNU0_RUBAR
MAVWVRILGLPVRFFKDFTLEKIGKMLGNVVKIDQVTMAQARGKFARLCIEIDLQKPLKPFIGVADMAYGVVYEGISMICFNCGCYGHAKESCPYLKRDAAQEHPTTDTTVKATHVEVGNMQDGSITTTDSTESASEIVAGAKLQEVKQNELQATKNENGPWMLMSYKNKRRNSTGLSNNKPKHDSGSRFELLQSFSEGPDGALHEDPPTSMTEINRQPPIEEPKIVKIWRKVQEKVNLDPSTSNTNIGIVDVVVNANVSKPLKDITNTMIPAKSTPKPTTAIHIKPHGPKLQIRQTRKSQGQSVIHVPTPSPSAPDPILICQNAMGAQANFSGTFGHCPPEPTLDPDDPMLDQVPSSLNNNDHACYDIANGNLQAINEKINDVYHPNSISDDAMEDQVHDSLDNNNQTCSGFMNEIFQDAAEKMEDVPSSPPPNMEGMVDNS